ncbi:IS200/IS605 family transposase [Actinopolymorpha pittospori]|uniref:Transposase n=1 Tax=Actinopolymorpha pittospori TaxID=648752 RepID=A0A927MP58_9ACTN|nr:IS200/IS605 family transposase [Actinopolymorpha pittospori]MBE1604295.1 putative transposase [Actinopolymorpha pittospori]
MYRSCTTQPYKWFTDELQDIRTGRHRVLATHVLVFVTKVRHKVFGDRHPSRIEQIMGDVCADFQAELVEFNGQSNHVHLRVNHPPKTAMARPVNSLKGVSSRQLRQEFPDLLRHNYQANKPWSRSYFAGSMDGTPLNAVKQHIQQQNHPA